MSKKKRFQHGAVHGEVKRAEPSDNLGELMIIGMPMVSNVDLRDNGGKEADCPLCGRKCWAAPHILQGVAMFPGRSIAACTECSLRANVNKGHVPRWMQENGLSPADFLRPIVSLLK